ncbi:MAG TPA: DUF488 domain-containing protein [Daejeonella sp.]|nr:DUF488 domain-containing protein [Daejeonella sp.]
MNTPSKTIWTIGHSNRPLNEFMDMLHSFQIQLVADIRSFPGSRHYPYFNKELLEDSLSENQIAYIHLAGLGGRRKVQVNSINTGWRLDSFRAYADYMSTDTFKTAIAQLEDLADKQHTAYMCSEALWWRCHRSLVSDFLKLKGWTVMHIMAAGKVQEHPYTSVAKIINGRLSYQ